MKKPFDFKRAGKYALSLFGYVFITLADGKIFDDFGMFTRNNEHERRVRLKSTYNNLKGYKETATLKTKKSQG